MHTIPYHTRTVSFSPDRSWSCTAVWRACWGLSLGKVPLPGEGWSSAETSRGTSAEGWTPPDRFGLRLFGLTDCTAVLRCCCMCSSISVAICWPVCVVVCCMHPVGKPSKVHATYVPWNAVYHCPNQPRVTFSGVCARLFVFFRLPVCCAAGILTCTTCLVST